MQVHENVERCQRFDHGESIRYDRNSMTQESAILRVSSGGIQKESVDNYSIIEQNSNT